ncbi:MAG: hypothetical protein IPN90_07135 [Elusimicrobia bacterium]|nr:hypothetical protein [Elusimicrobiota bacterium]
MSAAKKLMTDVIRQQPEDSSYDEIFRELALRRMVDRGLEDSRQGRVVSHEEVGRRIGKWRA